MTTEQLYNLFIEQTRDFVRELRKIDSKVNIHNYPGNFKINQPQNWFISFNPSSWGIEFPQQMCGAGMGFGFTYRKHSVIRFNSGTQSPFLKECRHEFYEEIKAEINVRNVNVSLFKIYPYANPQGTILMETTIPLNQHTAASAINIYKGIDKYIEIVAEKMRQYYCNKKYCFKPGVTISFP